MTALPQAPVPPGGRLLDARLSLLDRQVLDVDGVPVGVVDDLELDDVPPGPVDHTQPPPSVRALLHGPVILERLFGGRRPRAHFDRIGWDTIGEIGAAIRLAVPADRVPTSWLEDWLRDNLIVHLPGGRHVPG